MPIVRVRIATRTADQADQPILYRLGKDFHVVTNLRKASLSEEGGYVEVDLEGPIEEVHRAIAWLHTTGLDVSALDRSVGDGSNL